MRSPLLLVSILSLSFSYSSRAQEYSYAHYDIADGLASSTVYCITQDKDGFIWVGTEAGVCRFDGTHFQTFTTSDGLPDAEILQLFADSKGRIWMAPFRGSVCYFYQGRVHNLENDSLLARIGNREEVNKFAEDGHGDIALLQRTSVTVVRPDGAVKRYDSAGGEPMTKSVGISRSVDGNFNVQIDQRLFRLSRKGFSAFRSISFPNDHPNYISLSPKWGVWRSGSFEVTVSSLTDGRSLTFPTDYPFYTQASFSIVNDSLLFFNRYLGVEEYAMPGSGRPRKLLSGKKISRTFCDRAGSLWFTTLGSGIYRLISDEFRTVQLPENGMGVSAVETITVNRKGDALLVGDSHDAIFALRLRGMELARPALRAAYGSNRILFVHEFEHHRYVAGSDANVSTGTFAGIAGRSFAGGIKSACMVDDNRVLMGAPWGAAIFDLRRMAFTDTLWRGRITVVCHQQDTDYIGTLHGLWRIVKGRPPVFLGERDATLRNRISAMAEAADGVLWIASYDNIVTGYANGKVIATISQKNGLIGNICHCLLLHGRELWIGTDKGLNRIRLDRPGYPISCLTSRDGLSSDVVNSIYAIGSTVFVGTSAGLTYFDETKVQPGDECSLVLTAAISAGRDRIGDTAHLVLPVGENRLRFEYAGISYRSAGDITYRYRMIGLDSAWKETRSDFVDYQVLPPGKYLFQLQAVNKFGISSGLFSLPVQADAPYWQRGWFDALLAAACILSIWLGVTLRIRRIRRRHEERERVAQRMAELESTALQSQMNPHFIFNCLNSIQQYILDHEGLTANKYLTGFARIIRATLHNSSKAFIPLREEIDYLSTYLSLEKLRFKEKMDFTIEPDPGLDTNLYVIPPMLIQPFVENSMRHGLRHKTDGKGRILVRFSHLGNNLVVVVEDNGIGRKRAAGYKTREHIEYQSRGMSLTADRIRLINAKYNKSIQIEVADLEDGAGRPSGTRVTLRFPIFHQILQNEIL